jgi:hypothetical protein
MNVPAPPSEKKRAGQVVPASPNDPTAADLSAIICGSQTCCEHSETRVEILPPGSYHFAKERCTNCDRVLRFLPKPQTIERQHLNAYRIAKLAMCDGLTDWERSFVKSVAQQRRLSPRQQDCLNRLYAERLEGSTR